MSESKSKWEVNFTKVVCPECGAKQPVFRIPKNLDQLMFGGGQCEKCSCKMDKHGSKID